MADGLTVEQFLAAGGQMETAQPATPKTMSVQDFLAAGGELVNTNSMTTGERFAAGMGRVLDTLTLGAGDEITAGGAALFTDKLLNGRDLGESYNQRLAQARDLENRFREESPKTALGIELASGLIGLGKAKQAVQGTGSVLKSAVKGLGIGGTTGAVYGFNEGEGDVVNRLENATVGGALGGAIGTILGPAGYGIQKGLEAKATRDAAGQLRNLFTKQLQSELGAAGNLPGGKKDIPLTAAQEFTARWLTRATDDEIVNAGRLIQKAEAEGSPLTLFEALNLDQAYLDAKNVRTSRGGADVAGRFLQERAQKAPERAEQILGSVSDEPSVFVGSERLRGAAQGTVSALEKQRSEITKPLYDVAKERAPTIESDAVNELLDRPLVREMIPRIRKVFNIPDDAPDNSFEIVQQLRRTFRDTGAKMRDEGEKTIGAEYSRIGDIFGKELEANAPGYTRANAVSKVLAREIEGLQGGQYGGKRTVGILEQILSADPAKSGSAAGELLKMAPEQLEKVVQVYKRFGNVDELRAGLRSALQNKLETASQETILQEGSVNLVRKMIKDPKAKKNIVTILGPDDAAEVLGKLEVESLISKGQTEIGTTMKGIGSQTTPLESNAKQIFTKIKNGILSPKKTAEDLVDSMIPDENEAFTKALAEEIFKPATTKEFNRLQKFKREYDSYMSRVQGGTSAAKSSANKEAAAQASRVNKPSDTEVFRDATGQGFSRSEVDSGLFSKSSSKVDPKLFSRKEAKDMGSDSIAPSTVSLIKKFEGKSLKAYKDTGGVQTIGYGHTGEGVKKGKITEAEATEYLKKDLETAASAVDTLVTVPISQEQKDALISLTYNIGSGAFKRSSLLEKINAEDFEGAADEFNRWVYDNGKKIPGLVTRRKQESELFKSGIV